MRKIKVLSAAVAILLQVSPAAAADKLTLILDWFVNPDHGPIIVAQEQGYFAEQGLAVEVIAPADPSDPPKMVARSEEHTSELQSLMRISYAVFCLKKKHNKQT